jgi:acetoin utilization deacetylase AcuC-like enzyme
LNTAYISHPDCLEHDTGVGHPESMQRLNAIRDRLVASHLFDFLIHIDAPEVTDHQLLRVHSNDYLSHVISEIPQQGHAHLDPDTVIGAHSLKAAYRSAGAVVKAVDMVMSKECKNAFCAVRPPGHHAEMSRAMGFCMFNNIAVGAAHAMSTYQLERIAIVDFDVHQGNGTEQIFFNNKRILFCSTFQHPFYPYTPLYEYSDRMVSVPLEATAKSAEFRNAVTEHWLPAMQKFQPEMIFISAGFDAHRDDDMSGVSLTDDDYRWVTAQLMDVANDSAQGRIVSALEGGYELHSLARSVEVHIRTMMGL